MHDVTIRWRSDGVIELRPRLAPLPPLDRGMVIATVLLITSGFFVSGAVPPKVAAALLASCVAGELVLACKSLLLLLRPVAQVHEVPSLVARRRR